MYAEIFGLSQIESALELIASVHMKINVLTWLFRLKQRDSGPEAALKVFFSALELLGYGTDNEGYRELPSTEEDVLALIDAPPPPQTSESSTAIGLADLMGYMGSAIYSLLGPKERFKIFNFVIPIIIHNHAATRHPSTAYTWYLYAIFLGGHGISRLGVVRAWIKVADNTYRPNGGHMDAAVETCRAVAAHYSAASLADVDYSRAHQLWSATSTSNFSILSHILTLDLATQALSGRSIGAMFRKGKAASATLAELSHPSSRATYAPFIQV